MPMDHHLSRSDSSGKKAVFDDSADFFSSTNHNNRRFSFASDHDYLFPILVQNLAGRPFSIDPDQPHILTSSKNSFAEALKECQDRRSISDERQRPIDATATFSPPFLLGGNLEAMKTKSSSSLAVNASSSSRIRTGTTAANFSSPGTPTYSYPKGWSSERVPLTVSSTRRHLPFNKGKALPSKWEDAEKWIFSPAVGDNGGRYFGPPAHYRRPKSKSGPLGPPAYLSASASPLNASPLNACYDSGRVGGGFHASSPFLSGVLVADVTSCGSGSSSGGRGGGCVSGGRSSSVNAEPYIMRSASVHGWSDTMIESSPSLPSSQDDKSDSIREAGTVIPPTVLRKDVSTQMSPDGSPHSSQKERLSFSTSPPSVHLAEELERQFSKLEVRDVQVDDRVTMTRWSKKDAARGTDRHSTNITEWRKKTVETKASLSLWEVAENEKNISKFKRDEAKITAWENLQKAKAEASIRKLEMKLEKKRSSSMDKIINKLRSAQSFAQEMRSAVTASHTQQVTTTSRRSSYFRRSRQSSPLSGCFTCHAF